MILFVKLLKCVYMNPRQNRDNKNTENKHVCRTLFRYHTDSTMLRSFVVRKSLKEIGV